MRLEAFAGDWEIDREIEDAHAGRRGRFAGRATFTPSPDGLRYREEGRLSLDGAPEMAATRDYLWRDAGAGAVEVLFADGRPFHRFLLDEPDPAAEHACAADTYRVRYDFRHWPRWRAEWRVTGPRKDYRLLSRFRRAGR
jgi:hypothetical protein